jgi:hypothetical protein
MYGYIFIFALLGASMVTSLVEAIMYDFTYKYGMSMELDAILYIHPINACQGYLVGILFALIWFSYRNQGDDEHRIEFVNKGFNRLQNSKAIRI